MAEEESLALSQNLKFDHRVCADREIEFNRYHGDNVPESLRMYFMERVRYRIPPDFTDSELNSNNFVNKSGNDEYVNILDLNGLRPVVVSGVNRELADYLNYPKTFANGFEVEAYNDWLDENLLAKSEDEQGNFVSQLLQMITNFYADEGPFNPIWVTPLEAFKRYLGDSGEECRADRWQQLLGLATYNVRWLAVIKYTRDEIKGLLYRPTQLDAGRNPWHFPSHPRVNVENGGQAMALCSDYNEDEVLPEFIHEQFVGLTKRHVLAVGKTTESQGELLQLRLAHRRRLQKWDKEMDGETWFPLD